MNKRVIVTGKAVLSTVMASSIACSMLATNIHAEELETPPKELATVEESTETSEVIEQPTTGDADVVEGEPAESIQPSTGEVITYATIDYSKLDSALKTVQDGLRDESMYTKDSWAQFKPVYDKALGAKSDASLTQEDVDQLAMDLIGAFMKLRIDPGAETDLDIIVTMEKTDHNTMIVNLDSYDLLQTPRGTPDGEINEKTWVYHFSNWRYVYQKEFTQNGTYNVSCTDVFGNTETITFTVEGLEALNFKGLDNAISNVERTLKDESAYTEESWARFEPLYTQAKNARSDGSLTQADLDKLSEDLIVAFLKLEAVPSTELDIKVSTEKTDHNTVIVSLDSAELLQTPESDVDGEVNTETWVYHYKDGRYVYQKEYTQNGTYTLHCVDWMGNEGDVTFTVSGLEVKNEAPVINATDKTITVGDKFDPRKDVTAIDKEDGDITNLMTIKSNVDTRKAGEYQVTYTVTDTQGATTTKTIKVTVKAKAEETNKDKDEKDKDGRYIRQERYVGNMTRSFYLGDIPKEDIKAKYEGGVLRLSVPKSDMKQIENTSTISIE